MADMADFSPLIRTLAITLTRIANDFRLLASGPATGLDEIRLPPVQPGSSIMPGKVNPVLAEMLNMAMFHVMGNDTTVALAAQAGQLELNVMMPIIAHNLFEMMQVTIGSVNAFNQFCVTGIQANREKAEGWLGRNAIVVTALNPLIGYAAGCGAGERSPPAQPAHPGRGPRKSGGRAVEPPRRRAHGDCRRTCVKAHSATCAA
jgi:fumarate hydratase, class II